MKKLDEIFGMVGTALAIIMVIILMYAFGMFDAMLGQQEMYNDYHNNRIKLEQNER